MSEENSAAAAAAPSASAMPAEEKPIGNLILDTGPLIKSDPPVSTLIAQAENLYMMPSILEEIRDNATRIRVETTLMPFVKLRTPRPASVKFITDFARRTGDLEVMSRPDIHLLALTYELDVEQNGGDQRLRKDPAQKINNSQEAKKPNEGDATASSTNTVEQELVEPKEGEVAETKADEEIATHSTSQAADGPVAEKMDQLNLDETETTEAAQKSEVSAQDEANASDSDDGWITPSNLKKHQAKHNKEIMPTTEELFIKVALLTSDYAMQNVALRIGLNLVSPHMARITQLKNWVLRCHGCFQICKKMDRQFCPRCGQATLTRVSCTTADDGSFQIHLKRNFQYNTRGNVYSIPKPVGSTASGKLADKTAGGKNHWGTKLIFAEDQKEYERAVGDKRREKKKDLMDEDYLPNILTGERTSANGKIRLGPGRSINSKKAR